MATSQSQNGRTGVVRASRAAVLAALPLLAQCSDPAAVEPVNVRAAAIVFDGPSAVLPGDSIFVRTETYSFESHVERWPLAIYLSRNYVISTEDMRVADIVAVPAELNAHYAPATSGTWVRVPAGIATGRYILGLIVDPDGRLADSTREDNTTSSWLPVGVGTLPSNVTAAPQLLAPADRAVLTGPVAAVSFEWSQVSGATWYQVELDECGNVMDQLTWWDSCGSWSIWAQLSSDTTALVRSQYSRVWRWRVRGVDGVYMAGPASAWRTFRVTEVLVP